ncbi:hypothetical protein THPR109532_14725 [Thalassospira profundimaris]
MLFQSRSHAVRNIMLVAFSAIIAPGVGVFPKTMCVMSAPELVNCDCREEYQQADGQYLEANERRK